MIVTPTCAIDRASAVAKVVALGKPVVVLTPEGDAGAPLDALAREPELVVVFGNERPGIHPRWRDVATSRVSIPTAASSTPLNVATAAAVVLWELFRSRRDSLIEGCASPRAVSPPRS